MKVDVTGSGTYSTGLYTINIRGISNPRYMDSTGLPLGRDTKIMTGMKPGVYKIESVTFGYRSDRESAPMDIRFELNGGGEPSRFSRSS